MTPKKVHQLHALRTGSQAWFLPKKENSSWTKLLDWHLNFQISKFQSHTPQKITPDLEKALMAEEILLPPMEPTPRNLLLSVESFLPTKSLIVLGSENMEHFVESIQTYSQSLLLESIRVFLPYKFSAADFQSQWTPQEKVLVGLVEDR